MFFDILHFHILFGRWDFNLDNYKITGNALWNEVRDHPHMKKSFGPVDVAPPFRHYPRARIMPWSKNTLSGKNGRSGPGKKLLRADCKQIKQFLLALLHQPIEVYECNKITEKLKKKNSFSVLLYRKNDSFSLCSLKPSVLGRSLCSGRGIAASWTRPECRTWGKV